MRNLCRPLCVLVGSAILAASVAWADDTPHPISIPAGDLKIALELLMKQTGVELVYRPEQVSGLKTQGAQGTLKAEQAVAKLLAGPPLVVNKKASGTLLIFPQTARSDPVPSGVASHDGDETHKEGKKPSSQDFRVAQLDQAGAGPQAVEEKKNRAFVLEEVVVTGSRIPLAANQEAQEVKVYTREQIEQSGQTTVVDFLNTLPSVSQSIVESGNQTYGGATAVQLHGLPLGTTLVLINGHRVESSSLQANVIGADIFDLNNIPLAAVERIEVVSEGSSAVYGSDAIAGVVNVILRKNLNGLEINTKYGAASGINESDTSLAWGTQWTKGSASVIASYQARSELQGTERAITANNDYRRFGGPDTRFYDCNPGNVFFQNGYSFNGQAPVQFAAVPAGYTGTPSVQEFAGTAGTLNQCNVDAEVSVIPASHRTGLLAEGSYEPSASLTLFGEFLFSHIAQDLYASTPGLFGQPGFTSFTASAANPFNPFGQDVGVSYELQGLGRFGVHTHTDFFRPLVGATGSLAGTWGWEVSVSDAFDRVSAPNTNYPNSDAIQAALNSSNPSTALNPFVDGRGGEVTPANSTAAE